MLTKNIKLMDEIPLMVTRIAENISEGLDKEDAIGFFAEIPKAKDLSLVGWKFLESELNELLNIQTLDDKSREAIKTCRDGMALKAKGKEWEEVRSAALAASKSALAAALADKAEVSEDASDAALYASLAAEASEAAEEASLAAAAVDESAEALARSIRISSVSSKSSSRHASRKRQRDTFLRLLREAE